MGKTKAEEYEALIQIRKILKDFDPEDTYIGKAFEGCVQQAKENIDNDWLYSWKGRYLDEQAKNCQLSDKLSASEEHRVELTKQLNQKDDAIARLEDIKDQLNGEISRLNGVINNKAAAYTDLEGRLEEAQRQISDLRQTVLELKAKLYDMMTAGEEVKA